MKTAPLHATPAATWPDNANWSLRFADNGSVLLAFSYLKEDTNLQGELLAFGNCRASRMRAESLTREDQQGEDNRDGVIYEVLDSAWLVELEQDVWPEDQGRYDLHHYIVSFKDAGLYEFAAETLALVEDEADTEEPTSSLAG